MRWRLLALLVFLGGICIPSWSAEIAPPSVDFRRVERISEGADRFDLVRGRKPDFSVVVLDPKDEILSTAASDFARYIRLRWGAAPRILSNMDRHERHLIVLASLASPVPLPAELQPVAANNRDLAEQAFVIQRVTLSGNRTALLCLGGKSIGARYAAIEILRRMSYDKEQAHVNLDRVRDEPYSTWRAIYINDSAHQANNYDPNLVYPMETYRWSPAKWERYIDQMAFFRYNVLQIWLVPQMFTPKALQGGGVYDYVQNTLRAVARYARPRGITLCLTNGINAGVDSGRLIDTIPTPVYKDLPVYRYLSPNKPAEKQLMFELWDHWSKALPEVGIWQLFPGDPGGCHEQGCGPETYVDLSIQIAKIIKKNSPHAIIDFCPWQFFGWGPSWPSQFRKDTARIDRGYSYLVSKLNDFPPDTIFSPNLNDYTSNPPILGAGPGGNTVEYLEAIHRKGYLIHTWTYFVTEGEGWLNHHDRVEQILHQREIEAKYPIAGGICYTMTPALNLLNQYACSEAFWDPHVKQAQIMQRFTEGVFGTSEAKLIEIFPGLDIGPTVGYTFAKAPGWNPDFAAIHASMVQTQAVLRSLTYSLPPRFDLLLTPREYAGELNYFATLYAQLSSFGQAVMQARAIVGRLPQYHTVARDQIDMKDAQQALASETGPAREQLEAALKVIQATDLPAMKERYRADHYRIFLDYPTDFTKLLPMLINGFFSLFGGNFVQ